MTEKKYVSAAKKARNRELKYGKNMHELKTSWDSFEYGYEKPNPKEVEQWMKILGKFKKH